MDSFFIPTKISIINNSEFMYLVEDNLIDKNVLLFLSRSNFERLEINSEIDRLYKISNVTWIKGIPANPSTYDVYSLLKGIDVDSFDYVITIGGGSAIDLAKAYVALDYLNRENITEKTVVSAIKSKEYLNQKGSLPIIALPTTAGTGSELTRWATVWDSKGEEKYSIESDNLYPERAIIVPKFTLTMPARLTLSTGLDALCQATEAYWSKSTNQIVRELSKTAIRIIVEYLPKVLKEQNNLYFREKIALGSIYAGLAFSNTKTTACHSISYPLTMKHNIDHGLACAMTLPGILKLNKPKIIEYNSLLAALGVNCNSDLRQWILDLSEPIIRLNLSEFGVKEADINNIATLSFTLGRMDNNPVGLIEADVIAVLKSVL